MADVVLQQCLLHEASLCLPLLFFQNMGRIETSQRNTGPIIRMRRLAFFYSCLVSLLGDFPRAPLLWTRQKKGEAFQLLTYFLSSWSDFGRHGSCDCLLFRVALVLICPDSHRKMCKYVVVFSKRPQAEDLTFNSPRDSWSKSLVRGHTVVIVARPPQENLVLWLEGHEPALAWHVLWAGIPES